MAAAARLEDGCPRCGGKLEEDGRRFALCAACGAFWTAESAFQREVIARGLAGTRSRKYDTEYLEGSEDEQGTLSSDLSELVSLVKVMAFEEVYGAVEAAIVGRELLWTKAGLEPSSSDALTTLKAMREWLQEKMSEYGGGG